MDCQKLYRLDVNFKIQDTSLASLIGRTAHILMIECRPFFLNLIYRYREVFCEWAQQWIVTAMLMNCLITNFKVKISNIF